MPQRFCIGFPNLVADDSVGTIGGGSWLTALPVSNVRTWPLAEVARSSDATTTSTKITMDWGSAKSARALALLRHNLSSAATVRWKRGTTAGAADVADSGAVNAWRFTPRSYDGTVYDAQVLQSATTSARFETIEIDDTTNAAGYVQVGRLVIAPVFQPTWNPSYGLRDGHRDHSDIGIAKSGAQWPYSGVRQRYVRFALDFLSLSEGDTMHELEQIEGTTGEVLYFPYDDDAARMQRYGMVGLLEELSGIEYPRTLNRGRAFAITQRV